MNMYFFNNPKWLSHSLLNYQSYADIPSSLFDEINARLDKLQADDPIVSVVIPAWNEEVNVLQCLLSLSKLETTVPFEVIVVNNNSSDATQKTIDRLHIKTFFQKIPGCGPARQMGLEHAKGKYILLADADCIYPCHWLDTMMNALRKDNVVCVYGRYSFIAEMEYPRWKLFLLEKSKDMIAELRHFKRPYLNAYGMSMGFRRDLGLKVGFVGHKIRGEDGRLCFDLMNFGKVSQVRSKSARIWTRPRTLQVDGSLERAFLLRIKNELKRITTMFSAHPPHDTKVSQNR